MTVSLTGFMASGKTTFGKAAAERLGCRFVDLDEEIESRFGTIPEIFAEGGEKRFREIESEVLDQVLDNDGDNTILALGGGTILDKTNLELIKSRSRLIWLDTAWPLILSEVDFSERPLARERSEAELRKLHDARRPRYRQAADMVIVIDIPDYGMATDDVTEAARTILSL